jgi:hypothetical protein
MIPPSDEGGDVFKTHHTLHPFDRDRLHPFDRLVCKNFTFLKVMEFLNTNRLKGCNLPKGDQLTRLGRPKYTFGSCSELAMSHVEFLAANGQTYGS